MMVGRGRNALARGAGLTVVGLIVAMQASPVSAQTLTLHPITVLATKLAEAVRRSLSATSAVRQQELERRQPTLVSDALTGVPGVWFDERADQPETAVNIRGLQDFGRVAVIVDGARQNFQRSGHNASGTFFLEPELLAGIDVVRGPIANIYGSGAIGGVASFRTKDAEDILRSGERAAVEAHGLLGTNTFHGLASLFGAARVSPNVDVFAGGTYRKRDNYKDGHGNTVPNSAAEVATGIGKVTMRPAEGHEFKIGGLTYEADYQTGQQFPNRESVYDAKARNHIVTGRWKYRKPDDRIFDFEGSLYWTRTELLQTKIANGTPGSPGNPITGFIGDSRSFRIDTVGFDAHNSSRFETGDLRHTVTYGGDWFRDDVKSVDPTGSAAILTPSGRRDVSGAFAQWKVNYMQWLEVIGGLRYDNYSLNGAGVTSQGDHLSPKVTVGVTPVTGFTIYGTFAEGYRAPAVTETLVSGAHPPFAVGFPNLFTLLPNPALRPEVGQTKELGINLTYDNVLRQGDAFGAKFNIFRNDVRDYIELVDFGPPVTFCPAPFPGCPPVPPVVINPTSLAQYQNIGNARIEGVEFEANYDTGQWFAGLSAHHIRGRDITASMPLRTIPPDQLTLTLGVRLLERKLTLAARVHAVAEKPASEIPDRNGDGLPDVAPSGAYGILNLYATYQPTPDVLAHLAIENVFDQYYVPYLRAGGPSTPGNPPAIIFPNPGITVKGGVKVRFGV